ncbi:amidohydrolase family protein [Neobacillus niacini]|uniref:amidohydrolase family protein n=1 Tax=Neobacillus niacini TaxID=86668 RepID=UPI00069358AF|nr:amidohydrolase family protein [Neobacillus niacini]
MIIDVHTHFVPQHLPVMADRLGGDKWPITNCVCGKANHKHVMISGKNFRTITDQCWSPQRRLSDMDYESVSVHVLSPMPELLSYWFKAEDTLDFSRYINNQLSEFIESNPDRFLGLGMLPLQDPEMAAKEIKNLKNEFGLKGVEVGTNINGRSIGDPYFTPFFAEAEAEGITIFIHPLHPIGNDRIVGPPSLSALIGFPTENALAAASLITSGILEKFPKLKIILSHGGGNFSTLLPRLNYGWEMMDEIRQICPKRPSEYAKMMYYDTLVYDGKTLKYLIDLFGASQLMIGSDYPFIIREQFPGHWIDQLKISPEMINAIKYKNALQLFGINNFNVIE